MAPLNQAETLVCRCLLRCSTLEKIKTRLTCSSTLRPKCRHHLLAFFNQASQVSSLFKLESFKVIALDKHSVNRNLSSSFQRSKSHESSSFSIKMYCIKRSIRLIFVMLKDMN